ncbi:hypothetical protein N7486_007596 [Penicillium sp. IBT 16267x]|nr:hypothetical protein N7486_007596 [Penicillium sp. IBT 16267x]
MKPPRRLIQKSREAVWARCQELEADLDEDAIYVKIHDDIIFIEDNAILRTVTLVRNPAVSLVLSNVVNNPAIGWVHANIPEVLPQPNHLVTRENGIWRTSELPRRHEVEWDMPGGFGSG